MSDTPKFRVTCSCGAGNPRDVTAFTIEQWMRKHLREVHDIDDRPQWVKDKYPL